MSRSPSVSKIEQQAGFWIAGIVRSSVKPAAPSFTCIWWIDALARSKSTTIDAFAGPLLALSGGSTATTVSCAAARGASRKGARKESGRRMGDLDSDSGSGERR